MADPSVSAPGSKDSDCVLQSLKVLVVRGSLLPTLLASLPLKGGLEGHQSSQWLPITNRLQFKLLSLKVMSVHTLVVMLFQFHICWSLFIGSGLLSWGVTQCSTHVLCAFHLCDLHILVILLKLPIPSFLYLKSLLIFQSSAHVVLCPNSSLRFTYYSFLQLKPVWILVKSSSSSSGLLCLLPLLSLPLLSCNLIEPFYFPSATLSADYVFIFITVSMLYFPSSVAGHNCIPGGIQPSAWLTGTSQQ